VTTFLAPTTTGWLARRNPAMKLAAAAVPAVVLVATTDPLTPALVLACLAVALPFSGLRLRTVLRRARPIVLAATAVGVVNAVFGETSGGSRLVDLGPLSVTTGSAGVGLGIALRVLAIALPGVLVVAATDPGDLADSLVQQLRTPPRFAYGTLAALRLLPLLGEEWETLSMARRARGFDAGRSPFAALRLVAAKVLALLVGAIRRGTRLATAMDARGFDSGLPRTFARPQVVTPADVALVAVSVLVTAVAAAVSISVGAWRPLVGG